ncbi:hypothetical protein [Nonomuraea sp. NPDC048916]|uniref:hypothetical protein n=1 Tax=Nonomuraea sp. NPDC048916 TaxID=3154232 RepID=UPI0034021675
MFETAGRLVYRGRWTVLALTQMFLSSIGLGAAAVALVAMAPEPNVRRVVVGGSTAAQMDLMDSLIDTLPRMALVVLGSPVRRHPYSTGEPEDGRPPTPMGWVKVTAGRTRVVRPDSEGAGWRWVEVDP